MNEKIKSIIEANLKGYGLEKIILFGSRARGDGDADSDYDILAIIKEELDWTLRENICSKIRKDMAKLDINVDILVRSEKYIGEARFEEGNVIHEAIEEGTEI
ncbi:MAG: nucleotidyltransferase domain-containing protein [Ignavibacteria bacterium]|nr:nucleotidyltransferase domain-containing protein [Ignavibacteria bacterium]MCC7159540.1 nucleotidyltransferase domain-containing protein [Ignavibacteria bacterium]